MTTERKKTGIEKFLEAYFSRLGKFTFVNLIFAIPFGVSIGICYLVCRFFLPQLTTVVLPFAIVLAAPFYSGVVTACKGIYYDELSQGVFKEFIKSVRENFKSYFIHGIVAYVAFVGCYHGIVIYNHLAKSSWFFYIMLFVSVLVALLLLFLIYGAFMMSAFFDLKLRDVYKNSLLMVFGELKSNFIVTVGALGFLAALSIPALLLCFLSLVVGEAVTSYIVFAYIAVAVLLVAPSGVSAIVTAGLYPDMKRVITGEARANLEAIRKEDSDRVTSLDADDCSDEAVNVDIDTLLKSSGDYVFYKGRMIKKSVLLKELEQRKED